MRLSPLLSFGIHFAEFPRTFSAALSRTRRRVNGRPAQRFRVARFPSRGDARASAREFAFSGDPPAHRPACCFCVFKETNSERKNSHARRRHNSARSPRPSAQCLRRASAPRRPRPDRPAHPRPLGTALPPPRSWPPVDRRSGREFRAVTPKPHTGVFSG